MKQPEDEPEYTFTDFINEQLNLEGEDQYNDEEDICKQYKQTTLDYMWELYQSLK